MIGDEGAVSARCPACGAEFKAIMETESLQHEVRFYPYGNGEVTNAYAMQPAAKKTEYHCLKCGKMIFTSPEGATKFFREAHQVAELGRKVDETKPTVQSFEAGSGDIGAVGADKQKRE